MLNKNNLYVRGIRIEEKIDENSYLHDIACIRQLENEELEFNGPLTFLIGENGTGKSTLIEAIAISSGFNPEGGTRNFAFSTSNTHSELCDRLLINKGNYFKDGFFLRAESFYNLASNADELGSEILKHYGGISLHEQSHGESFLAVVRNRMRGKGLYIFDEPEAALSPSRLMELICHMHDLIDDDSQFIIATHSPILMSYPGATVYELSEKGIHEVDYRNTEHYRINRDFIEKPEVMYRYLFEDK